MEMKGFVHIRIDDRLIHGQVAGIWSPFLNVTRIMVIDDQVIGNDIQKQLLKMATPAGVKLSILSKEKALENILQEKYVNQRVLLVVKTPKYIKYLVDNGIIIKEINVGNLSPRTATTRLTNSVSITDDELDDFKYLLLCNVDINVQMVPKDDVKKLKNLI